MKKIMIRVLTLGLACVMVLSLAACGGGKFSSIDAYVKSDTVQSQLETLLDSLDGSGMEMTVKGEGNKLIYEYTFNTDLGDTDTVAASLEQALDANASTFESVASELKKEVNVDNPVVVVRYLSGDGSELCSREFSAE
ncbi:hypothetical protein BN3661_01029 [Eubacteriaceae bacterium CHKCI005]|uniref:DUF4854 domain-containing protein n=1 Tax=Solibaculum mannosilyticum TaxID=2780922 RepID=A0A7I8D3G4_9FIRM|nr:DUF4854 domain-containing protein [Solibaculum mannosilyticum]BCI61310.1 hypothetical protein C12CBH8_19490 [Solibaculum mannosilyticum]CZT55935.1 hypothetical protein BN3661_01029 [Eubacteriaceae bacterium CHKCI005]